MPGSFGNHQDKEVREVHLFRYSLGVMPFFCLKIRLKVEMLEKPELNATSVMEWRESSSSVSAALIRRMQR